MRLKRIRHLNFASFENFQCDDGVKEFTDINIMLGWNGSGKTTLSRVLRFLESGEPENNCAFKIDTSEFGSITESSNFSNLSKGLKIFNKDYVKSTLVANKNIPHIFYIGEEGVDYSEKEEELVGKREEEKSLQYKRGHDGIATDTARLICSTTGINTVLKRSPKDSLYKDYNKNDFETRIKLFEDEFRKNEQKITIEEYIRGKYKLTLNKAEEVKQQIISFGQSDKAEQAIRNAVDWITENEASINLLLQKTPQHKSSQRIEALDEKSQEWVKDGVDIHFPDGSNPQTKCLFCNSDIKNQEELRLHFSQEVMKLSRELDGFTKKIENYKRELKQLAGVEIHQKERIEEYLNVLSSKLKKKSKGITVALDPMEPFSVETGVKIDRSKNGKSDKRQPLAEKIECHYIAEVAEKYFAQRQKYIKNNKYHKELSSEIKSLEQEVSELKSKARNTHKAAEKLNAVFQITFPYSQITIRDNSEGTGYELARNGNPCDLDTLSEGEHNFLALLYFLASLDDKEKELDANALIVIDDPISSLDKNSIFQIFSHIVHEISKRGERQYIIMTHNLDFLGHLLEHYSKKIRKKKVGLYNVSISSTGSQIENMHELLKKYRSDYYYVFYFLKQKLNEGSPEDAYLIVNLLRRWLETFLGFKFSSDGDLRSLLEKAYEQAGEVNSKDWPPHKCDEMYRFLHHGSHGFPDTEKPPDESIWKNAHPKLREAFDLVKTLDPLHYSKLEKETVASTD